jgi:hypothetical protein
MKMNEGQCAPARWVHRWEETQRRRARAPAECMIIHASAWRLDTGPGRRLTNERIVGSSRFPWSSDNVPGFKREGSPEGRPAFAGDSQAEARSGPGRSAKLPHLRNWPVRRHAARSIGVVAIVMRHPPPGDLRFQSERTASRICSNVWRPRFRRVEAALVDRKPVAIEFAS